MDLSPLTKNQNKKCMRLKKQKSKEGKHGKRKRKSSRQKEPKSPNKVSAADRIRSKFKDIGTIKDNRLILHKNVDNAGLFNHRIQSHHNNLEKVFISSSQPCHNIFTDYTPEVPLWTVARLRIWRLPLRLCEEELQPAGPGRHARNVWRCCTLFGNYTNAK